MMNNGLDPKMIHSVNRAIDAPSQMDLMMNNVGSRTNFIVPGLNYGGHRQFNHDLLSAMMKGYQFGGAKGAEAAFYHLMGDRVSDGFAKSLGSTDMRDAWESLWLNSYKVPKYNFGDK